MGDPEYVPPLTYVRDHFLAPYVSASTTIVEIGPGGGRWTRYMLGAQRIYAVDYHQELLDELQKNLGRRNITFVKNNGDDFPGVPDRSVDLVFSFGCFVHLDTDIIARYLDNIRRLLKPDANVGPPTVRVTTGLALGAGLHAGATVGARGEATAWGGRG